LLTTAKKKNVQVLKLAKG